MSKFKVEKCPCFNGAHYGKCSGIPSGKLVEMGYTHSKGFTHFEPCTQHLQFYKDKRVFELVDYPNQPVAKPTSWKTKMYNALQTVAANKAEFTNDDVFDLVPEDDGIDRRTYGSIVTKAVKAGLITWTGRSVVTRRKNCNKMLIRVWKSNVYKPKSKWASFKEKYFDKVN